MLCVRSPSVAMRVVTSVSRVSGPTTPCVSHDERAPSTRMHSTTRVTIHRCRPCCSRRILSKDICSPAWACSPVPRRSRSSVVERSSIRWKASSAPDSPRVASSTARCPCIQKASKASRRAFGWDASITGLSPRRASSSWTDFAPSRIVPSRASSRANQASRSVHFNVATWDSRPCTETSAGVYPSTMRTRSRPASRPSTIDIPRMTRRKTVATTGSSETFCLNVIAPRSPRTPQPWPALVHRWASMPGRRASAARAVEYRMCAPRARAPSHR